MHTPFGQPLSPEISKTSQAKIIRAHGEPLTSTYLSAVSVLDKDSEYHESRKRKVYNRIHWTQLKGKGVTGPSGDLVYLNTTVSSKSSMTIDS